MELTSYDAAHLVAHLLAAARGKDAHRLLCWQTPERRNYWYEFKTATGDTSSYANDVNLAWYAADRSPRKQSGKFRPLVDQQCLFALIIATLRSFSVVLLRNPELLVSLAENHVWSWEQALDNVMPSLHMPGADAAFEVLERILPHLSTDQISQALAAAYSIADPYRRSRALNTILPYASEDRRHTIITDSFAAATKPIERGGARELASLRTDEDWVRSEALTQLVPFLDGPDRTRALREILEAIRQQPINFRQSRDRELIAERLAQIAPLLPAALLEDAVTFAGTIEDPGIRSRTLVAVASLLSNRRARFASLAVAAKSAGQSGDVRALVEVASHLGRRHQRKLAKERRRLEQSNHGAPQRAEQQRDEHAAVGLAQLRYVPPDERFNLFSEELARAAKAGGADSQLISKLLKQIPLLPNDVRGEALARILTAVRRVGDETIMMVLEGSILADNSRRPDAQDHSPTLDTAEPTSLVEVLAAASAAYGAKSQVEAVERLLPGLPERERLEAVTQLLSIVRQETDKGSRAWALARLASELPHDERPAVLAEAAADACNIVDSYPSRGEVLSMLAEELPQLQRNVLYPVWTDMLHALASYPRQELASDIYKLAPVIQRLASANMRRETTDAVNRVRNWWP